MKTIKKLLAVLTAFVMTFAMGLPVFADSLAHAEPSADDRAAITVDGVDTSGAAVTAYRIIEPVYDEDGLGFVKYKDLTGQGLVDDAGEPTITADKINGIDVSKLTPITLDKKDDGTYQAEEGAGTYLIKVTNTGNDVYNDMIVSVNYTTENGTIVTQDGRVNADTNFTIEGADAYAKKTSSPDIEKKIIEDSEPVAENDAEVGDTVDFRITGTIPSYGANYTDATYTITDTLENGFDPQKNIIVEVGSKNEQVKPGDSTYSLTQNGNTMTIAFKTDYILSLADKTDADRKVVITYQAAVNKNATYNFDPNDNTAKLIYSNSPTTTTDGSEHKTHTYTFGIDAALGGNSAATTHEITKGYEETTSSATTNVPLANATFKLTNTDSHTSYEATSDTSGHLSFTGLDAGTFELVETKAPTGYSLENKTHTVVINPEYNDDGTLKNYTVTIDGQATSTYRATYNANGTATVTEKPADDATTWIKNTPLSELPSTGGHGTMIFTLVGCGIMIAAAVHYFGGKKAEE